MKKLLLIPNKKKVSKRKPLDEIREAVANYMQSEGCSCCEGESHEADKERLAKLLRVPKYKDGSGYDFGKFESK